MYVRTPPVRRPASQGSRAPRRREPGPTASCEMDAGAPKLDLQFMGARGCRILVVDDDPLCCLIIEKMLRRCGYEGASSGCARSESPGARIAGSALQPLHSVSAPLTRSSACAQSPPATVARTRCASCVRAPSTWRAPAASFLSTQLHPLRPARALAPHRVAARSQTHSRSPRPTAHPSSSSPPRSRARARRRWCATCTCLTWTASGCWSASASSSTCPS